MNESTVTNNHLKNILNAIHYESKSTLLTGGFNVNLINFNNITFSSYSFTTILHHKLHSLLG